MLTKKLSDTFQIANLFATILVVAIHFNSKRFISIEDTLSLNYIIQEFITNGVARIAVPFFAFSAGLFFFLKFKSLYDYHKNLIKRTRSIILPYIIGSLIIFSTEYIYLAIYKNEPFLLTPGSLLYDIILHPRAIQFWFLRDLIILIFFSPVIWLLTKYLGSIFTAILLILWTSEVEFMPLLADRHLISIETLTFFSLGCLISSKANDIEKLIKAISKNQLLLLLLVYCILIAYRIDIDPFFKSGGFNQHTLSLLIQKTHILLGVFLLLAACYQTSSKLLIFLSSYTFFVYIYHTISINRFIVKFSDFFIIDIYKFYFTFPLSVITMFILAILVQKYFAKIYAIITGGRTYEKVLNRVKTSTPNV